MVESVKRAESYIIDDPYTLDAASTIATLKEMMKERGVGSILVTEPVAHEGKTEQRLIGIITTRDIRFAEDNAPISQYMTPQDRLVVARVRDYLLPSLT